MRDTDRWAEHVRLVMGQLNERQRRLLAGLLAEREGWGGDSMIARITRLDLKTIKRGRDDLNNNLADCPTDRIRREGAGRPQVEKKSSTPKTG